MYIRVSRFRLSCGHCNWWVQWNCPLFCYFYLKNSPIWLFVIKNFPITLLYKVKNLINFSVSEKLSHIFLFELILFSTRLFSLQFSPIIFSLSTKNFPFPIFLCRISPTMFSHWNCPYFTAFVEKLPYFAIYREFDLFSRSIRLPFILHSLLPYLLFISASFLAQPFSIQVFIM